MTVWQAGRQKRKPRNDYGAAWSTMAVTVLVLFALLSSTVVTIGVIKQSVRARKNRSDTVTEVLNRLEAGVLDTLNTTGQELLTGWTGEHPTENGCEDHCASVALVGLPRQSRSNPEAPNTHGYEAQMVGMSGCFWVGAGNPPAVSSPVAVAVGRTPAEGDTVGRFPDHAGWSCESKQVRTARFERVNVLQYQLHLRSFSPPPQVRTELANLGDPNSLRVPFFAPTTGTGGDTPNGTIFYAPTPDARGNLDTRGIPWCGPVQFARIETSASAPTNAISPASVAGCGIPTEATVGAVQLNALPLTIAGESQECTATTSAERAALNPEWVESVLGAGGLLLRPNTPHLLNALNSGWNHDTPPPAGRLPTRSLGSYRLSDEFPASNRNIYQDFDVFIGVGDVELTALTGTGGNPNADEDEVILSKSITVVATGDIILTRPSRNKPFTIESTSRLVLIAGCNIIIRDDPATAANTLPGDPACPSGAAGTPTEAAFDGCDDIILTHVALVAPNGGVVFDNWDVSHGNRRWSEDLTNATEAPEFRLSGAIISHSQFLAGRWHQEANNEARLVAGYAKNFSYAPEVGVGADLGWWPDLGDAGWGWVQTS